MNNFITSILIRILPVIYNNICYSKIIQNYRTERFFRTEKIPNIFETMFVGEYVYVYRTLETYYIFSSYWFIQTKEKAKTTRIENRLRI